MTTQRTLRFNVEIDSRSAEVGLESVSIKAENVADSVKKVNTVWENFSKKMKTFFNDKILATVMQKAKTAFIDWTKNLLKTNDETRGAISSVKGALLTMVQPLAKVIIPAFTLLANAATRVIYGVTQVLAKLFGTTMEESSASAEALYEETKALDSAGTAAKKAAKNFSGLDEINSWNSGESGSGAAMAIEPNFDAAGMKGITDELMSYFTGALLAIGAILTFESVNPHYAQIMFVGIFGDFGKKRKVPKPLQFQDFSWSEC